MFTPIVQPYGDTNSKIAFIGEAPSYEELKKGEPFVGRSGQILDYLLVHAGIRRSDCYITNLFKFMVSKSGDWIQRDGVKLYNMKKGEFTLEGDVYRRELIEELKAIGANVVVPLGGPALSAVTTKNGILKWRGSILWSDFINKKVVPTIHPAATLRVYIQRYWIMWDLRRVKEESSSASISLPDRRYIIEPSYIETVATLESYSKCSILGFDIEVLNLEVSCLSFAKSWDEAICIPFVAHGSNYFDPEQEYEIWNLIGTILRDKNIVKVGQNLTFDNSFLFQKYGIEVNNIEDTMIAHKLIFPNYPAGLDFITSTRTREPYYKDEGKMYIKLGVPEKTFWIYNCKDSMICRESWPSIDADTKRLHNEETYQVHKKLVNPCIYMGIRGLKVDIPRLEKVKEESLKEAQELQERLNSIVGTELNARSSKQVATYFYVQKKIKPYMKGGSITTDDGALKRIARKGYEEARIILRIRTLLHDVSTYYNVKLKDGRLVCSYKPVTSMGRLASSKDIFGYGTNMQNQPKRMNDLFIADEGCILYNVDLSQADNRSVAYMAPEYKMIKAFEDGEDVHSLTASLVFKIPVAEIKQMHKEGVKCDVGYGDMSHRDWGKRCNHAFNFGYGYRSFSHDFEIQESEGKFLWESYHQTYPGVQRGYHKWIQNQLSQDRILTNCFNRKYRFVERWGDELFKQAYAFPAQSNTADIINRWGLIPLYYDTERFGKVDLLRQVHDSIEFQIPISEGIEYHIRVLKQLKESLEQKLRWKTLEFSIPANVKFGVRLSEMKELDFSIPLESQLGCAGCDLIKECTENGK